MCLFRFIRLTRVILATRTIFILTIISEPITNRQRFVDDKNSGDDRWYLRSGAIVYDRIHSLKVFADRRRFVDDLSTNVAIPLNRGYFQVSVTRLKKTSTDRKCLCLILTN